jgi:hypothetical protein
MRHFIVIAVILACVFVGLWVNVLPVRCEHCGGTTHHTNLTDVLCGEKCGALHLSCALEIYGPSQDAGWQLTALPSCQLPQAKSLLTNRIEPMHEQSEVGTVVGPRPLGPAPKTARIPVGRFSAADRPLDGAPKALAGEQESPS